MLKDREGNIGMSECPGKNMEKSRNGRPIRRSVQLDIEDWTKQGVAIVLCLLNDYEIRTLGVDEKLYKKVCLSNGVELVQYPIIEMSVP